MKDSAFITVCLPSHKIVSYEYLKKLSIYLNQKFFDYEILIIEPKDKMIKDLDIILEEIPCIRSLEYSGYFNNNSLERIAMINSIGDYLICFNPATDPYESIESILKVSRKSDVVIGVAEYHKTIIYRLGRSVAKIFIKYLNNFKSNTTDLICISRNAINTILKTGSSSHYIFVDVFNSALSVSYYNYKLLPNINYSKNCNYAISRFFNLLIFTSIKPLRIVSIIGFVAGFISFIIALGAFIIRLLSSNTASGWTSIIMIISFFFMIVFVILSFLSEYIGRILEDLEKSDDYYIYSERTSKVMIKEDRLNVLSESK
jgi:hypothetical protein